MGDFETTAPIEKLVGVYDANGTLSGELAYWFGARLGVRHCALCDVTHGTFREKPEWQRQAGRLPVQFTAVHLDERGPVVAKASAGKEPCVVALRTDGSADVLVDASHLEACDGEPDLLADLLLALLAD
jgi:hypothetical protein